MRLLSWSCVLSSTSALVLGSLPAIAGSFSVGGTDYEVKSIFGTWEDASALVEASPWWDDLDLALDFASTVQDAEGLSDTAFCSPAVSFGLRTPCHGYAQGTSGGSHSPFFAASSTTFEAPVASRDYDFEYFTGAIWSEGAVNPISFQPVTDATVDYRTDDGAQYWAYAVEADNPQDVPEPATLFGLLGLAGVLLGVKRHK